MKTTVVANYCARVKFLQVKLLVVELARRLRVRLDKHLTQPESEKSRRIRTGRVHRQSLCAWSHEDPCIHPCNVGVENAGFPTFI